jgi:hypothetical protein
MGPPVRQWHGTRQADDGGGELGALIVAAGDNPERLRKAATLADL